MGPLSWIVVGALAGWLSGQMIKGRSFGLIGDIVVGVIGGLIGGWLSGVLFKVSNTMNDVNATSILVAFAGAILLLIAVRVFEGRRSWLRR